MVLDFAAATKTSSGSFSLRYTTPSNHGPSASIMSAAYVMSMSDCTSDGGKLTATHLFCFFDVTVTGVDLPTSTSPEKA